MCRLIWSRSAPIVIVGPAEALWLAAPDVNPLRVSDALQVHGAGVQGAHDGCYRRQLH